MSDCEEGDVPTIAEIKESVPSPIPMVLHCPECKTRHVDEGDFATKAHHTHSCQGCGLTWRPAVVATVGVQFLPGFKNDSRSGQAEPDLYDPPKVNVTEQYEYTFKLGYERARRDVMACEHPASAHQKWKYGHEHGGTTTVATWCGSCGALLLGVRWHAPSHPTPAGDSPRSPEHPCPDNPRREASGGVWSIKGVPPLYQLERSDPKARPTTFRDDVEDALSEVEAALRDGEVDLSEVTTPEKALAAQLELFAHLRDRLCAGGNPRLETERKEKPW